MRPRVRLALLLSLTWLVACKPIKEVMPFRGEIPARGPEKLLEQLLKQQGLKVIMSRSRDVFIPLQDRSALGNSRRNAIFVSIHYNYNRGGSGAGAETYYHFSSSYMLAAYIQAYLVQRTSMTNRGVKSAGFHVIRATSKNPAVLVECGFVSNSTERARMMTGEYRKRIAEGIAQGIIAYRKSK